ncbi:MAG TPA: S8 family serine peptidase [Chitinophagaceae bacterium]
MRLSKLCLPLLSPLLFVACRKATQTNSGNSSSGCSITKPAVNGGIVPDQYIVAYKPSLTAGQVLSNSRLTQVSQDILQRNHISSSVIQKSFGGEPCGIVVHLSADQAARLSRDGDVLAIEHDRIVALSTCFTVAEPSLLTWNVKRVGYGDGTGKTAWIVDTGIDFTHPDLTVDQQRSKSFLSGNTSAADENGHGTHVAGIIGGKNNEFGVLGVASGATLISLRVLDKEGSGTVSGIIQALAYINSNGHAGDVVNLSVGEDSVSNILDQQVLATAAKGIFITMAAGNDDKPARDFSPGRVNGSNIFTVSAIDSLDNFASFSNYGNDVVDYAAPGVRILSTYMGGKYAYMTGTSMASPHVAALLLLRGVHLMVSGAALNDPDGTADPIAHY